ncbi:hypothetical protein CA13_55650 [Planctomycetes bacterium CA13]|uniref:Alpha-L-fucosidase C-terminal domain-containing protein n=1 Tax=Novipirellula herctigrandis TaxID=2527986 RepID=A0A5C5Z9P5_9BACT|nr:hypothetical protein CA13_55650 [Planctomycetes bacterium CA13]
MGERLKLNGEAVHETRPWGIYGEGPTKVVAGHYAESENAENIAADIRFTTKGDTLYATSLGWPQDGVFTIKSLAKGNPQESRAIRSVGFVSGNTKVRWRQTNEGLVIQTNGNKPNEAAYAFRIFFQKQW